MAKINKIDKQKKAVIDQLRKTPIVQVACERIGVGRSTYYKWRKCDTTFARVADKALEAGRFFINDLAESKLLRLVQDSNLTSIIFWLKHNHPKYAVTTRFIHEYELVSDRASPEEVAAWTDHISSIRARKMPNLETTQELKDRVEEELKDAEREEPERKRREALEEDIEVD